MEVTVSSDAVCKDRWTELVVAITAAGYHLTVLGRSRLAGENTLRKTSSHPTPESLLAKLARPSGGHSRLAQSLVDALREVDPDMEEACS